jgi:hypothetical protein
MKYTAIIDNYSYDLPAKTMAVAEKLDEALKVDVRNDLNIRAKYQLLYDTVNDLLGAENAEKALGGTSLDTVDLSNVTLAFRTVVDAYDKPVADYAAKKARERLAASQMDQVIKIANAAQMVQGMKK